MCCASASPAGTGTPGQDARCYLRYRLLSLPFSPTARRSREEVAAEDAGCTGPHQSRCRAAGSAARATLRGCLSDWQVWTRSPRKKLPVPPSTAPMHSAGAAPSQPHQNDRSLPSRRVPSRTACAATDRCSAARGPAHSAPTDRKERQCFREERHCFRTGKPAFPCGPAASACS